MKTQKRGKLEIIKDLLSVIHISNNSVKITPLIRKANMSSARFRKYYSELLEKGFVKEVNPKKVRCVSMTDKGFKFLEKYKTIISFIEEFEL